MQIGTTTVVTPKDNPFQFAPDWRNAVATAIVDFPDFRLDSFYNDFKDDPYINTQVKYLRAVRNDRRITRELDNFRLASTVSQGQRPSDVRFKLESLLLTAVNFDVLSQDLAGGGDYPMEPEFFKTYERLYFSCRDRKGELSRDCHLRMYFALPDAATPNESTPIELVWRTIGATLGYQALVTMWMWSNAHGFDNIDKAFITGSLRSAAQTLLLSRIVKQQISNFDLVATTKTAAEIQQNEIALGQKHSGASSQTTMMSDILSDFAPRILSGAKTVDEHEDQTNLIALKMKASRNVHATLIEDAGADVGMAAFDDMLAKSFASKKE